MAKYLRRIVSKNKKRYQLNGFDLDLAFINCKELDNRLLAMGFPAEGKEAWYRNSLKEVRRFLEYKNGSGNYKVYNLTVEKTPYEPEKLGGLMACYGFEDHQVPALEQMQAFCEDLDSFLGQHPQNLAAVHCKAGKGRTGVMICAYLLHKGYAANAKEALETYAQQRSKISAGVTVPSQRRYVHYFEAATADQRIPEPAVLSLDEVHVSGFKAKQLSELVVRVSSRLPASDETTVLTEIHSTAECVRTHLATRYVEATPTAELRPSCGGSPPGGCVIEGDVRIEVFKGKCGKNNLLFRTWFNTAFVSTGSCTLREQDLDKGAGAVQPGTVLRLLFGEAPINYSEAGDTAAVLAPTEEQIPILDLPCVYSPVSDSIPAVNLSTIETPRSVATVFAAPHIFDVHPDFSIPSNFCLSPTAPRTPPPTPPFVNPFSSTSAQLPPLPDSLDSSSSESPVRELSERLESLALLEAEVPNRLTASRRTVSSPFPQLDPAMLKEALVPPPRTLSLVRTRFDEGDLLSDPELMDFSAPTTPSLPRPFNAFDWRRDAGGPDQQQRRPRPSSRSKSEEVERISDHNGSFLEGSASGPDSPSHGARLIKWMSASWWLDMA